MAKVRFSPKQARLKSNHDKIRQLLAQGETIVNIAFKFDVNKETLRKYMKKNGLEILKHKTKADLGIDENLPWKKSEEIEMSEIVQPCFKLIQSWPAYKTAWQ